MKIDMEIMYVPQANIYQLRDMMQNWKDTSHNISMCSYVCAVLSLVVSVILYLSGDDYFYMNLGSAAVLLVCGFFSERWYYMGYASSFIGFLLCIARFGCFPIDNYILTGAAILAGSVPVIFAYKCIYNYKNVFKELKKREGFPNFIANTADLYADKIYLRTEKEKGKQTKEEDYIEKTAASYNPFSTQADISEEEFCRQQTAKVLYSDEVKELNIDSDEKSHQRILLAEAKNQAKELTSKRKYGVTAFGKEIIFLHNDIHTSSIDDKRSLMWKWNNNIDWTMKNFGVFAVVLAFSLLCTGLSYSLLGRLLHFLTIIVFMIGTSYMKQNKWYGALITGAAVIYTVTSSNHILGFLFLIGAYCVNPGIIFGTIRFALNYKIYKQLSKEEGFPSFIRTTADLYGDKLYIVEKQPPKKKVDPAIRKVKVMNIGEDDTPKNVDNGAWNAFDYMDKKSGEND